MGYEVIYSYHSKNEEGPGYNTEETKTLKRKVGTPYDDTPLEDVAKAVMMQLARREILVVDVEIFEFAKKKLSYRESNGGIVIKNQKFTLDQCGSLESRPAGPTEGMSLLQKMVHDKTPQPVPNYDEEVEFLPEEEVPLPVLRSHATPVVRERGSLRIDPDSVKGANVNFAELAYFKTHPPLREEVFAPRDKAVAASVRQRGLAFTIGKKYPIFEEKPAPGGIQAGINYVTRDDKGNKQIMNMRMFDTSAQLIGGEQFNSIDDYGTSEVADQKMPSLR